VFLLLADRLQIGTARCDCRALTSDVNFSFTSFRQKLFKQIVHQLTMNRKQWTLRGANLWIRWNHQNVVARQWWGN